MNNQENTIGAVKANYPTEEDKAAMMLLLLNKIDQNTEKLRSISTILTILFVLVLIGILFQGCTTLLG